MSASSHPLFRSYCHTPHLLPAICASGDTAGYSYLAMYPSAHALPSRGYIYTAPRLHAERSYPASCLLVKRGCKGPADAGGAVGRAGGALACLGLMRLGLEVGQKPGLEPERIDNFDAPGAWELMGVTRARTARRIEAERRSLSPIPHLHGLIGVARGYRARAKTYFCAGYKIWLTRIKRGV